MSQYLTMLVNIRTSGNIIISGVPQSIAEVNEDLINHGENPVFAVYRPVPTDTIEAAVEPTDYALELLGIPKDRPDAIVALDLPGDNAIEVSGILPLFEPEEGESFKDSVIATFQDLCYIMVSEFEKQFGAGYSEEERDQMFA